MFKKKQAEEGQTRVLVADGMINPTLISDTKPKFGDSRLKPPESGGKSVSLHLSGNKNLDKKLVNGEANSQQVIDPHKVTVSTKIN